jgi:hypothetical protein
MSKKDCIAIAIIIAIAFTMGFVIGHRVCEMKNDGISVFTYAPESIND